MGLYFIFTVDGDWNEYFHSTLSNAERQPDKQTLLDLIGREMRLAASVNGRLLHFVHTSPVAPDFFLQPEFLSLWKEIKARGGGVGVHCHAENLYRDGRLSDPETVDRSIRSLAGSLAREGINPVSYRGGYLAFCEKTIPLMEKNGLLLDFSCDPGRHLRLDGELVADWRGAPDTHYRMSYEDHRRPGKSNVVEIPLGKAGGGSLYVETVSLLAVWKAARTLAGKARDERRDIIVSVLSHTYEFASFRKRLKITLALRICSRYGVFINDQEALELIARNKGRAQGTTAP